MVFLFVKHICSSVCLPDDICQQVQDIEFMQIEMKVIEGLKVGNDCLKSMHEVFFDVLFAFWVKYAIYIIAIIVLDAECAYTLTMSEFPLISMLSLM